MSALIYPSVTGILSGLSKSEQLKNPSHSLPKGIFLSIIITSSIYLLVCWLFGMTFSNRILKVDKFISASVSYPHELIVRSGVIVSCMGLLLGHLSTAPNVLAAISSDNVLPFLSFLRPSDEEETPIRALWLSAFLVVLPTLGGNLDRVSPFTTIFYLLMYAGLNAATCISGYVRPPGFRPTFRYFHWSVSFLGFVWCLTLSFLVSSTNLISIHEVSSSTNLFTLNLRYLGQEHFFLCWHFYYSRLTSKSLAGSRQPV
jgi:potassium/chloride transporter 4/5/6